MGREGRPSLPICFKYGRTRKIVRQVLEIYFLNGMREIGWFSTEAGLDRILGEGELAALRASRGSAGQGLALVRGEKTKAGPSTHHPRAEVHSGARLHPTDEDLSVGTPARSLRMIRWRRSGGRDGCHAWWEGGLNSDQICRSLVLSKEIELSMEVSGRGSATDFWRSVWRSALISTTERLAMCLSA